MVSVINVKHNSSEKSFTMKVFDKKRWQRVLKHSGLSLEHLESEKRLLQAISHPFILGLDFHFVDNANMYFVQEHLPGRIPGDSILFRHLKVLGRFSENVTCFYAAQVVQALEYLHSLDVIYRNLEPENLLLDHKGYLKITGFEWAKRMRGRTWSLCGTPEYLAPDIIWNKGYGKAVDWWTLGILIYDFARGISPFAADQPVQIYEKATSGILRFPSYFSSDLKDLLKDLIQVNPRKRYGNLKNGAKDIKDHPWFASTQWMSLLQRQVAAPIVPKIRNPTPEDQEFQKMMVNSFVLRLGRQPSYPLYDKCFEDF